MGKVKTLNIIALFLLLISLSNCGGKSRSAIESRVEFSNITLFIPPSSSVTTTTLPFCSPNPSVEVFPGQLVRGVPAVIRFIGLGMCNRQFKVVGFSEVSSNGSLDIRQTFNVAGNQEVRYSIQLVDNSGNPVGNSFFTHFILINVSEPSVTTMPTTPVCSPNPSVVVISIEQIVRGVSAVIRFIGSGMCNRQFKVVGFHEVSSSLSLDIRQTFDIAGIQTVRYIIQLVDNSGNPVGASFFTPFILINVAESPVTTTTTTLNPVVPVTTSTATKHSYYGPASGYNLDYNNNEVAVGYGAETTFDYWQVTGAVTSKKIITSNITLNDSQCPNNRVVVGFSPGNRAGVYCALVDSNIILSPGDQIQYRWTFGSSATCPSNQVMVGNIPNANATYFTLVCNRISSN